MKTKNTTPKIMLAINVLVIAAIFVLNFFYQKNGFDFTLKCVCSGMFALLGVLNLGYAAKTKQTGMKLYVCMSIGLILAFLGDYLIGVDFIIGTATFALAHVFFITAYCFMQKMHKSDLVISGVLFLGCFIFLMTCSLLKFDTEILRAACIVYSLIISTMLGKAIGNLIRNKNKVTGTIAIASALFFFSDLMLVFDMFMGIWDWADNACMGTYYPALCLLAFSMILNTAEKHSDRN